MTTAAQQLMRAWVMAAVSTFLALALHIGAGGHSPQLVGVAIATLGSLAASAQLARKPLTRWRIAVAAVLSQAFFHAVFVVSAGSATSAQVDAKMAAQMAAMGHTTPGTSGDGMGMAGMSHSGSAMVIAHLVAAAVTYWALRNAELWWSWLLAAGAWLLAALAPLRPLTVVGPTPRHTPASSTSRAAWLLPTLPLGMRAPPVSAV
jgi:hypothetical protein